MIISDYPKASEVIQVDMGKNRPYQTTTKTEHNKAQTVCIIVGKTCMCTCKCEDKNLWCIVEYNVSPSKNELHPAVLW